MEILDHYFNNVCELDLVFNFHKVRAGARLLTLNPVSLLAVLRQRRSYVMPHTMCSFAYLIHINHVTLKVHAAGCVFPSIQS